MASYRIAELARVENPLGRAMFLDTEREGELHCAAIV